MASYDADVTIKIDADTSNAEQALSQLGKSTEKALKSPSSSMKQMGVHAQQLEAKINKTISKMQELGAKRIKSEPYKELESELERLGKRAIKVREQMQDLEFRGKTDTSRYEQAELALTNYRKAIIDTIHQMKELQQNGGAYVGRGYQTREYADLQQRLAILTSQADVLNQRIKEASTGTTKLSTIVKSLFNAYGKAFRTIGSALKNRITRHNNDTSKSFKHLLRQLLKYGLGIRSLFLLYKKLRQYGKEAFKDMATQYPEINAQLSDLVSTFSQMTHSIATAFQPLLSVVLPVLNAIMNAAIAAANAIGSFFAALTGQGFIYKAIKQQKDFAGAVGGTGSAAKDAKEELAEYDKLLVIDQNDAGGGGGGGGAGDGGSIFFEKADLNQDMVDLVAKIKEAWSKGDFTELGTAFGKKIADALNNIPWDDIKAVAYKIGTSIATFINGAITPESLGAVGRTLAEALNTALTLARGFLDKFDWIQFGTSIATGVTEFFKTADFAELGSVIHDFIAGALDAAITFFTETDFELIGQRIGEFLANLDIPDLVGKLYNLAKAILGALADAIKGFWSSADTCSKIVAAIAMILGALVFTGKLGTAATNILNALGLGMEGKTISVGKLLIAAGTYQLVGAGTAAFLGTHAEEAGFSELAQEYHDFAENPIEYTFGAFADIASFIKEDGFGKFGDVLAEVFSPNGEWMRTLKDIFGYEMTQTDAGIDNADVYKKARAREGIVTPEDYHNAGLMSDQEYAKIQGEAQKAQRSIDEMQQDLLDAFKKTFNMPIEIADSAGTEAGNTWYEKYINTIKKTLNTSKKSMETYIRETNRAGIDAHDEMEKEIPEKYEETYEQATNKWRNLGTWAKQRVSEITRNTNTLPSDMSAIYGKTYKESINQFAGIGDWAQNSVVGTITAKLGMLPGESQAIFKKSYDDDVQTYAGIGKESAGWKDSVVYGFSDLPNATKSTFKQSYANAIYEFKDIQKSAGGVATRWTLGLAAVKLDTKDIFMKAMQEAQGQTNEFSTWFNKQTFKTVAEFGIDAPSKSSVQNIWNDLAGVWQDKNAHFTVTADADLSEIAYTINKHIVDKVNSELESLYNKKAIKSYSPMSRIKVPGAARGAVLPPNQPFLAMLGDQTSGTNVETPLSTMIEAFNAALDSRGGTGPQEINLVVGGRQIAQVVWDETEKKYKQTGRR